ncbi:MAG: 6,7-dimethyl-8-ribityllumazine synthase [Candidatus Auribacterota bacterium]|jgi:6,7-dimethyl-8-ribityllumazine synthase|nr:6,7-dimethyl-8-ribityllumazine synthase [Candidatus Auribacterota bacterium]
MHIYHGDLVSQNKKYGIVISRFNDFITSKLLDGAYDTLIRHNVDDNDISVFRVPGAFEIPVMTQKLASTKKFDAIICLGALIRGNTPHFEYISGEVTKGIAHVSLQYMIPITYGLITADTLEQAIERAGTKSGNKGADAALSAIEMVNLFAIEI